MSQAKKKSYKEKVESIKKKQVEPLNDTQAYYLKCLKTYPLVVAIGCAGTAKTFIPSALGATWLRDNTKNDGSIEKVVIARPTQGPSKSIGLLPGTADEKLEGWVTPVTEAMKYILNETSFGYHKSRKSIEFLNLEQVKGRTFDRTLVIVDEAEDLDVSTIKTLLTRIGENSVLCINGDIKQKHIKKESGLDYILRLKEFSPIEIPVIEFGLDDIVRSGFCRDMIIAMDAMEETDNK